MEVLSDLVNLSLEMNEYDNVHRWADRIIAAEPNYLYFCQHPGCGYDDILERSGMACYIAYYGKAFACFKQGDHAAAIRNFKNASICDSSCHATYYLLAELKRTADQEKRFDNAEGARQERDLVYEGQATEHGLNGVAEGINTSGREEHVHVGILPLSKPFCSKHRRFG